MRTFALILVFFPVLAAAKPWWMNGSTAKEADFLSPDAAFKVSATLDGHLVRVHWKIAEGYYLYRTRFEIAPESPDLVLDSPVFPQGLSKRDEFLGTQEIFENDLEAIVGFRAIDAGAHPLQIRVTYQGCAIAGLCYPPIVKVLNPQSSSGPSAPAPIHDTPVAAVMVGIVGGTLAFFLAGLGLRRKQRSTALS